MAADKGIAETIIARAKRQFSHQEIAAEQLRIVADRADLSPDAPLRNKLMSIERAFRSAEMLDRRPELMGLFQENLPSTLYGLGCLWTAVRLALLDLDAQAEERIEKYRKMWLAEQEKKKAKRNQREHRAKEKIKRELRELDKRVPPRKPKRRKK